MQESMVVIEKMTVGGTIAKVQPVFYSDPIDAVFKALGGINLFGVSALKQGGCAIISVR